MASIILTSDQNTSTINNEVKLSLPRVYKSDKDLIALTNLSLYYSWYNLTSAFDNLTGVSYVWTDGTTHSINFVPGFYTAETLSSYIQFVMKANGHYLVDDTDTDVFYLSLAINETYYSITLTSTIVPTSLPTGWSNPASIDLPGDGGNSPQLVIGNANWGNLIGYATGSFPTTLTTVSSDFNSSKTPVISPVSTVMIGCSWVNDTRFSKFGNIIGVFSPSVSFGSLVNYTPPVILPFPVLANNYSDITLTFYDQQFRALTLVDTNQIVASLVLTKEK